MIRSESLSSGLIKRDLKSATSLSKRGSLTSVVSARSTPGRDSKLATAKATPDRASIYRLSASSKSSQKKDLSEISVTWSSKSGNFKTWFKSPSGIFHCAIVYIFILTFLMCAMNKIWKLKTKNLLHISAEFEYTGWLNNSYSLNFFTKMVTTKINSLWQKVPLNEVKIHSKSNMKTNVFERNI